MAKDPSLIIAELEKQFTGDAEHDLDILRTFCEKLEHTEDNYAIVSAIGHYIVKHFPDNPIVQDAKSFEDAYDNFTNLIETAQNCYKSGQFEKAAEIYEKLIGQTAPANDPDSYYFAFSHPFEEMIVRASHNYDDRKIERIPQLPEILYFQQGSAYFELKNYEKARAAFQNSLKLNPVCCRTLFELLQIEKALENYDKVRSSLKNIHPYIFNRHYLARFYREHANLARIDHKNSLCVALLYLSIDYEDSDIAHKLLDNLKLDGVDISKPSVEDTKQLLNDAEIPIGPYPAAYELAIEIGNQMKKINPEVAKMAYAIAYDLTHYQPLLKELQ